jgi:hypothetical protein
MPHLPRPALVELATPGGAPLRHFGDSAVLCSPKVLEHLYADDRPVVGKIGLPTCDDVYS